MMMSLKFGAKQENEFYTRAKEIYSVHHLCTVTITQGLFCMPHGSVFGFNTCYTCSSKVDRLKTPQ